MKIKVPLAKMLLLLVSIIACVQEDAGPRKKWEKSNWHHQYSLGRYNLFGPVASVVTTINELQNGAAAKEFSFEMTFNKKGNITTHILYQKDGSLGNKETFTYNKKGEILEIATKDKSDAGWYTVRQHFSYEGNMQTSETEKDKGEVFRYTRKTFDSLGRVTLYVSKSDYQNSEVFPEYDKRGRMYKSTFVEDGKRTSTTSIYDAAGNEIGSYDEKGDTAIYNGAFDAFGNDLRKGDSCTYDAHNNWIKMFRRQGDRVFLAGERTIEYYPE